MLRGTNQHKSGPCHSFWEQYHSSTPGVGISTLEMTSKDSMRDSSSFTFLQSDSGTFLGVCRARGVASGLRWIWNSTGRVPRPKNRAGNWLVMSPRSSGSCLTSATLAKRLSSSIAGMPNRFSSRSLTTKTMWVLTCPFDDRVRVTYPKTFNG